MSVFLSEEAWRREVVVDQDPLSLVDLLVHGEYGADPIAVCGTQAIGWIIVITVIGFFILSQMIGRM